MAGTLAAGAPSGWAAFGAGSAGALAAGGTAFGESAAAAGTFLVSNPIGWAILGTAAVGGVAYLGYTYYQNAHSQSQARFKEQTITNACSTCHNCNDLEKEIDKQQKEVDDRYDAMLKDQHDLYAARPGPIAGKEYLGTWPGHQTQFKGQQGRLRKLLNAAKTADCPIPNKNQWESASKNPPTKPAGR